MSSIDSFNVFRFIDLQYVKIIYDVFAAESRIVIVKSVHSFTSLFLLFS